MKRTWLDGVLNQKFLLYTFVVVITLAVTVHLWSDKICLPDEWSDEMLREWLQKNHIFFEETDSREVLIEKVKISLKKQ
ncbi:hypothetical protein T552_00598 [Pneumocystis carinii B80]|uniref:Uncharacterized protein n=1 Tax=Pneumocystis carinii (strain B80) TaxID=1408658 RepID=A0A0W4ZP35_PNEC8|nr:hypothetical protein T552_00598 [Pneumocystis carinii B80]KTW30120.1 hypothetical protein T552_00598 [Pneumocystis carinii B80]